MPKSINQLVFEKKLLSLNEKECIDLYLKYDTFFNKYQIQISTTDFEIEKEYLFKSNDNKLKGYFMYKGIPILLYGDIECLFKRLIENKICDIFHLNKKSKNLIPISYESPIYEYELSQGNLNFKGEL